MLFWELFQRFGIIWKLFGAFLTIFEIAQNFLCYFLCYFLKNSEFGRTPEFREHVTALGQQGVGLLLDLWLPLLAVCPGASRVGDRPPLHTSGIRQFIEGASRAPPGCRRRAAVAAATANSLSCQPTAKAVGWQLGCQRRRGRNRIGPSSPMLGDWKGSKPFESPRGLATNWAFLRYLKHSGPILNLNASV